MTRNRATDSTFKDDDVTLLLTNLTGQIEPKSTEERERLIQSGTHYSEMIPEEKKPSAEYETLFCHSLNNFSEKVASCIAAVSEKILMEKGAAVVLVSLARAGIPIGILIKRFLKEKYGIDVPHYAVSIVRWKGIDKVAMSDILAKHNGADIQFVDGWTGKGAITRELRAAIRNSPDYSEINSDLAVLADPAGVAAIAGTTEDFLIPSSCLNSTVCGLVSRTILNEQLIDVKAQYHGFIIYEHLRAYDRTYEFIDAVESHFEKYIDYDHPVVSGLVETQLIAKDFGIKDINLVKPGIGEATRVLLRRLPWKILVKDPDDEVNIGHLIRLAYEKNVPVEVYPLLNYKAVGLIKELSDA